MHACLSIFQHHKYKRKKLKATAMEKVGDLETCIKNRIKEIEEEEERNLKILKELETQIMSPTEKGRSLDHLSQTDIDKKKKILSFF